MGRKEVHVAHAPHARDISDIQMRKHALIDTLALTLLCMAIPERGSAQDAIDAGKTVWAGVYSAAQAEQGKSAYQASCGPCHKEDLSGYESILKGDRFMEHWREDTLLSFFTTMKSTMPRDAPGSLNESVYVDIAAFILQGNGFPSGPAPLRKDDLPGIRVQGKSGPSELPTGALAQLVGCLVKGPKGEWTLTLANPPQRTRNPSDSNPQELKLLDASPLGTRTYGLMDAIQYRPDSKEGHKVEAKGFLIRDPGNDRINLTSLQTITAGCGR